MPVLSYLLFKYKPGTSAETIKEFAQRSQALQTAVASDINVISIHAGPLLPLPANLERGWQAAQAATFASNDDLVKFAKDPAHEELKKAHAVHVEDFIASQIEY